MSILNQLKEDLKLISWKCKVRLIFVGYSCKWPKIGVNKCLEICANMGRGGGSTPNGKNHLNFLFRLVEHLPKTSQMYCRNALYCPQVGGMLRQQILMKHGIAWYCMILHGIACYCIVLHCFVWCCKVLHGIAWYCVVLHGTTQYFNVLHDNARYCMALHDIEWFCN